MENVKLIVIVIVLMTISLVAIRFYVFICDTIMGGIKRLFGFGKKKNINWHTLDDENGQASKQDKKTSVEENYIDDLE